MGDNRRIDTLTPDTPEYWNSQFNQLANSGQTLYSLMALSQEGFIQTLGNGWTRHTKVEARCTSAIATGPITVTIEMGVVDPQKAPTTAKENYIWATFNYTDTKVGKPITTSIAIEKIDGQQKTEISISGRNHQPQFLVEELRESGFFASRGEADMFRYQTACELLTALSTSGSVDTAATQREFSRLQKLNAQVHWPSKGETPPALPPKG